MKHNKYPLFSFICLINLIAISSSHAEVKQPMKSNSSASEVILTQSELSNCNEKAKHLAQIAEQLKVRLKQLQTVKKEMDQLEQERTHEYKHIDFHNKTAVTEYNNTNQQLNQLSQSYTTDATNFNVAVKQYKADSHQLTNECDDKQYFLNP